VEQGRNIVDACAKEKVELLVQSSVFSSGMKDFGVAHLDSKTTIVNYLKISGLPYAILKPHRSWTTLGPIFSR